MPPHPASSERGGQCRRLWTRSQTNPPKLERVLNEAMRVMVVTTKDTPTESVRSSARSHTDADQTEGKVCQSMFNICNRKPIRVRSLRLDRSLRRSQASSAWALVIIVITSVITDDGSKPEIPSMLAQATAALTRLKPIWNDRNISVSAKIRLMRSLLTSIFLYACES